MFGTICLRNICVAFILRKSKIYLRSIMAEYRLNGLEFLNIYRDIINIKIFFLSFAELKCAKKKKKLNINPYFYLPIYFLNQLFMFCFLIFINNNTKTLFLRPSSRFLLKTNLQTYL